MTTDLSTHWGQVFRPCLGSRLLHLDREDQGIPEGQTTRGHILAAPLGRGHQGHLKKGQVVTRVKEKWCCFTRLSCCSYTHVCMCCVMCMLCVCVVYTCCVMCMCCVCVCVLGYVLCVCVMLCNDMCLCCVICMCYVLCMCCMCCMCCVMYMCCVVCICYVNVLWICVMCMCCVYLFMLCVCIAICLFWFMCILAWATFRVQLIFAVLAKTW